MMDPENIIPAAEIIEKLNRLPEILNINFGCFLSEFARYFAQRLNGTPELNPIGFSTLYENSVQELQEGKPQVQATSFLIGTRSREYGMLRVQLGMVAKAVCPYEFAEEVRSLDRKSRADLKARLTDSKVIY